MRHVHIFTSDLHFTDAPSDEYRFGIFDELAKHANAWRKTEEDDVKFREEIHIWLLGDLTDKKDHHSGRLLNRIFQGVKSLVDVSDRVHIVMGNHDYTDPSCSSVATLGYLNGVTFYDHPRVVDFDKGQPNGHSFGVFPHDFKAQENFPDAVERMIDEGAGWLDLILLHQCVDRAKSETGMEMKGLAMDVFDPIGYGHALAGDIHVPQTLGDLTYCGAPYPISWNDKHDTRILVWDSEVGTTQSVRIPSIKKETIVCDSAESFAKAAAKYNEGDQIKVEMRTTEVAGADRFEAHDALTRAAKKLRHLNIRGISVSVVEDSSLPDLPYRDVETDVEVFEAYCAQKQVKSRRKKTGETLL
tara:strand:+ start:1328 stop:2401 length:1074 start_codon:yes stop_codon:yes gene_type:complete